MKTTLKTTVPESNILTQKNRSTIRPLASGIVLFSASLLATGCETLASMLDAEWNVA